MKPVLDIRLQVSSGLITPGTLPGQGREQNGLDVGIKLANDLPWPDGFGLLDILQNFQCGA
jgi:hypothetical protein